MNRKPSLRERLLNATSEQEIDTILLEGEGYKFASNSTRARWRKAARLRRTQLKEAS